ncbi:putative RNA helicase [Jimgerdemannia flammicorona]|uniref:Putative RNA helicase n=1 Tax=Jimgerdemannia flammicorona TaxID=994334 RepID=A0A433DLD3_9FUNG|nr:putative RNA helicase [Jimgerdemannia flammicorona]
MKIVNNVRPDKQTVLFSATFPRQMEALARKVLRRPLEITVGGRSVVCEDVSQVVEVREDSTKFVRLLDILGQLYHDDEQDARTLIFVDRQEAADNLLRDLIRRGYPCMSLHGGKDQTDRDSTIADFKSGVTQIMIATSVAARGLDVKQLKLVVNYECPNHMEDYVHRVGRTGRAGNKGTAYTFITPEQDRFAMDIVKALKLSGQPIPTDLQALADKFQEKVKTGNAHYASSGFGGKGLERLDKDRDLVKKIQKKVSLLASRYVEIRALKCLMAYGAEDEDEEEEDETVVEFEAKAVQPSQVAGAKKEKEDITPSSAPPATALPKVAKEMTPAALAAFKAAALVNRLVGSNTGAVNPQQMIKEINERFGEPIISPQLPPEAAKEDTSNPGFAYEIEINDYPQKARWKVTNKEQISQITEISGAAITTRGTFFPPGKQPSAGERKLFLFIEGESEMVVDKAKNEIRRILTETTLAAMEAEARGGGSSSSGTGRYSVI